MHTIAFANPKGGTGKSTSALILAEQLASSGLKTAIIDNDPSQNLLHWYKERRDAGLPEIFKVFEKRTPENYDELVDKLDANFDMLVVDMEGVKDLMASVVTMSADLVVIPLQLSPMDARNAASQVSIVRMASKHTKRAIPYTFLFTRTNAIIKTKLQKSIQAEMHNLPVMSVSLVERAAYKHMHEDGQLLSELREVSGLEQAKANAIAFAQEIIDILKRGD